TLAAADPDGDPVSLRVSSALPAGAHFDPATRQFQWTPAFDQAGDYVLRFAAQDPAGLTGITDVLVHIDNVNRAPVLPVADHAAALGQPLGFTLLAADPDAEDHLTFSADRRPEGADLDSKTGQFRWTPGPGQAGDHVVTFSVSDGRAITSHAVLIRA